MKLGLHRQPLTVAVVVAGALGLCSALMASVASAFAGCALASTASAVVYCLHASQGSNQRVVASEQGWAGLWCSHRANSVNRNMASRALLTRR